MQLDNFLKIILVFYKMYKEINKCGTVIIPPAF
jgi:hypothetical protein